MQRRKLNKAIEERSVNVNNSSASFYDMLKSAQHSSSKSTVSYLWPLLVAGVVRILMFSFAHLSDPNFWEYGNISKNLLHGHGYAFTWDSPFGSITLPTAFMPPGQVMIQWAVLSIFGEGATGGWALFILQAIEGVVFTYFTARIANDIFKSEAIERVTLWLAALYPAFVIAGTTFGSISPVLTLNAVVFYAALQFSKALRSGEHLTKRAIYFGISGGVLAFFRAESPLFVCLALLLLILVNRRVGMARITKSAWVIVTMLVILTPWTIRNYQLFHRVLPSSTSGAFNFWRGNNATATGSSYLSNGYGVWTTPELWQRMFPAGKLDSSLELRYADYHLQDAKAWVVAHPKEEVILALRKLVFLWGIDWYDLRPYWQVHAVVYFFTLMLLVYALVRMHKSREYFLKENLTGRDGLFLIALGCIVQTAVVVAFFSLVRFQMFMIGIYFPIIGYAVHDLYQRRRHRTIDLRGSQHAKAVTSTPLKRIPTQV